MRGIFASQPFSDAAMRMFYNHDNLLGLFRIEWRLSSMPGEEVFTREHLEQIDKVSSNQILFSKMLKMFGLKFAFIPFKQVQEIALGAFMWCDPYLRMRGPCSSGEWVDKKGKIDPFYQKRRKVRH